MLSEADLDEALDGQKSSRRDQLARDTRIPRWRWLLAAAIPALIGALGIRALASGDPAAARVIFLIALVSLIFGFSTLKSKQAAARRALTAEFPTALDR
jgi:hypothetical protein